MNTELIAKTIGYIALFEGVFIFVSKKRSKIIILKFISDFLWAINHFLLKAYSGAFLFVSGMARETVFFFRGKYKWANSKLWLILFLILSIISPLLKWQGVVTILPAIGTIFAVFGFYSQRTMVTKSLNLVGQLLWLIYAICIMNYQNAFSSLLGILSGLIGIINEKTNLFKRKKEENIFINNNVN